MQIPIPKSISCAIFNAFCEVAGALSWIFAQKIRPKWAAPEQILVKFKEIVTPNGETLWPQKFDPSKKLFPVEHPIFRKCNGLVEINSGTQILRPKSISCAIFNAFCEGAGASFWIIAQKMRPKWAAPEQILVRKW